MHLATFYLSRTNAVSYNNLYNVILILFHVYLLVCFISFLCTSKFFSIKLHSINFFLYVITFFYFIIFIDV